MGTRVSSVPRSLWPPPGFPRPLPHTPRAPQIVKAYEYSSACISPEEVGTDGKARKSGLEAPWATGEYIWQGFISLMPHALCVEDL
jgi:hypothetical protein